MTKSIVVNSISKKFKINKNTTIQSVDNISFEINQGEIVGYIGPNGAGKSTTIKIITGILSSDSGSVTVNNKDINKFNKDDYKEIGIMFGQKSTLWWDLNVIDSYEIISVLYDIPRSKYEERLNILKKQLEIEQLLNKPVRKLSLGQRVLCDFASLFIYNPKIIILDEPTLGLDFITKNKIRKFIKYLNTNYNTTFIITSHDLKEIEELCSKIIIINKGKVSYSGELLDLKRLDNLNSEIEIEFVDTINVSDIYYILKTDNVEITTTNERTIKIKYNPIYIKSNIIISRISFKYEIMKAQVLKYDLNTILESMYEN